jgi:colanic acid biosynthesis glycosyl transferase WcaI
VTILIILMPKSYFPRSGRKSAIPSKTIAYLAYGRPIITCTAGDATDVVRDAGAGLVCAPDDPAALAQAVRELVAMPLEQRKSLVQARRKAFLQKYT